MNFIDELAPFAVKHGLANGVLPSLILSQGILESGSGTSELARNANNLFGIKAGSGWTGPTYTKRTSEQHPDGTVYYIDADFRKYPSYEDCVIDLCRKYTHGTGWEPFNRYSAVLNQTDYKKATAALRAAGYATDVKYAQKLNERIEQYGLTKYDKVGDSMVKIYIDPGHGGTDPGATGNGLKEKDLTLSISKRIESMLKEYEGVQVKLSRTTDQTVSLKQRTDAANAWNADFLLSVHINATPGGYGYEDYIFNGKVSSKSIEAQSVINAEVSKMIPEMRNRGKKRNNLHMVRESNMPSILTETGFIDSPSDSKLLKSAEFLDRVALGHVNGIAEVFDLKKKAVAPTIPPVKEDDEMQFTSGTLRKEWETFLNSKAQREIAVKAAVKAGYSDKWIKDLEDGKIADGDVAALAIGALIRANK